MAESFGGFFFGNEGKKSKSSGPGHHSGPRAAYTCKVCGEVGHNARRHSSGGSSTGGGKKGEASFSFSEK